MRPGGPAGLPYLGDDLPCLHLLPLPHQKLAAVDVEGHIPAAMVDSQVLSIDIGQDALMQKLGLDTFKTQWAGFLYQNQMGMLNDGYAGQ